MGLTKLPKDRQNRKVLLMPQSNVLPYKTHTYWEGWTSFKKKAARELDIGVLSMAGKTLKFAKLS